MLTLKTVKLKEVAIDYGLMLPELIMEMAPNTSKHSFFYKMNESKHFPETRLRRDVLVKDRVFLVNFGDWIRSVDAIKYAINNDWRPASLRTLLSLPYYTSPEIKEIFQNSYSHETDEMENVIFMSMRAIHIDKVCWAPFVASYGGGPLELSKHRIKRNFEFNLNHWFVFESKT